MTRVLVVDDDPGIRRLVAAFLTAEPCHIVHARSGEEALALAGDAKAVDVVISDVELPGMCGYETVTKIRERHPDLRAIYISGAAGGTVRHADSGVPTPFLAKPFERGDLLRLLRTALPPAPEPAGCSAS